MLPRLLFLALVPLSAAAQSTSHDLTLVMPHGPGKITIHLADGFHPSSIALYDDGSRPVLGIVNDQNGLDVSYILFPNDTGGPTAESCRDAVVPIILHSMDGNSSIQNQVSAVRTLKDGRSVATTSYFVAKMKDLPLRQQELFGFFGDKDSCAEIHISRAGSAPSDTKLLDAELEHFDYAPGYVPSSVDYGGLASVFFEQAHDPKSAAPYYQSALDNLTDKPIGSYSPLTLRRVLTDQLSMSYGMAGDLKRSRAVNEAAIAKDPDYPLYYYNLACADAESNDAASARKHLEQAFARRANTLPGEHMPDPATDDSILKLKHDAAFWSFVQALPKS